MLDGTTNACFYKNINRTKKKENTQMHDDITPFYSAEEAWFWFIQANSARQTGARVVANAGLYRRPCEPSDIFKIIERLRRHRRLDMHHFRVMKHYGERLMAPDSSRAREHIASNLWGEAMEILEEVLINKGIVKGALPTNVINFKERQEAMQTW
jgi:hypothetical protein